MTTQEGSKSEKHPLTPYNVSVTEIRPGIYSIGGNIAEPNTPDDNDSDLKLPRVQTLLTSAILANRIMEWGNKLIEKKIEPWVFFRGVGVKIPKYDGQLIHYSKGLRFEGSPELVFWDFIKPFLKRGIDEWLEHIAELCLQNAKKPEPYLQTVRNYLEFCINKVYSRMSEIDYRIHKAEASCLASENFGENIPKRDTSEYRVPMINYLNKNYERVLEATKTSGNKVGDNTKPQKKAGWGKKPKGKKKRSKAPTELLKEARERQAVKELGKNPNITCRELGKILGCHESTVIRLKAWKQRGVLSYEGQEGLMTRQKDDSCNVDGIVRNKPDE